MKNLLIGSLAMVLASSALAHDGHNEEVESTLSQVGTEFMVMETTTNEEAEQAFLRGLALLHNFEYDFAAESFRQAQEADPDFVMSYWGEAMTHNHPLWEQQDRDAARKVLARLGPTAEARVAKARSAMERKWLDAVETLYAEEGTKEERDLAYLAKMQAMLASHSGDIDVRAFTGLAVLGSSHGGRQIPLYMRAAGILEPGFMTHEMHPGILHYLIHSYDDPVHAPLGERMAERYAVVAPDAGHAQHMVSHIFYALADWEATEAANVKAAGVVNRQRAARGRSETSCGHYNEWLAYALLQQGKGASELIKSCHAQAASALARIDPEAEPSDRQFRGIWSATRVAAFLGVATGEWLDPLAIPDRKETAAARFQQAHAQLLQGRSDAATVRAKLAAMEMIRDAALAARSENGGDTDSEYAVWGIRAIERGKALLAMAEGDRDGGLAMLEEAATAELALPVVFGPPPILKPSYEILGEELLADGRKEAAAAAFAKALKLAPGRRLSLAGLAAAQ